VKATDGAARTGTIMTAHGPIETPAFMPVGTQGSVKAMLPAHVRATGAEVVLGNTYHLMLRPGAERLARLGGLHEFMKWPYAILTDSGGYQVMSLATLMRVSEDGVKFRSHIDGTEHMLAPERCIELQRLIGSDIVMVLDECTSYPVEKQDAAQSMKLSMRWAARCRSAFDDEGRQALFGIVQGSVFEDLRLQSVETLNRLDFDGYAIGGLAVGEGQELMLSVLSYTCSALPHGKPRYLMGVGKPHDIVSAVVRGVDMFDCVLPTRSGRHGQAFTHSGIINITNARYAEDPRPLDEASACPASSDYSRAYLHHLFKAGEYLGPMLLTWHNLNYYQELMGGIRAAIVAGEFGTFAAAFEASQSSVGREG
jgi:queuine tRNA-ribosyltransferase